MVHDQSISRPCAVNYATIGEAKAMIGVDRSFSIKLVCYRLIDP